MPGPLPYPPPVSAPVPGISWNDPAYVLERKRATNRRVAVWGGIVGLVTAIIQTAVTAVLFLATNYPGADDPGLVLLALLIIIFGPMIVGVGWIASFIVALIACTQAHSQADRLQPDGWTEAKMPTSAQLAASIVLAVPLVVTYAMLYQTVQGSVDQFINSGFQTVVVICVMIQILLVVAYTVLLRKNTALDVAVRNGDA